MIVISVADHYRREMIIATLIVIQGFWAKKWDDQLRDHPASHHAN